MEIQIERTRDYEALAKLNETVQSLHQKMYPNEFKQFDFNSAKKSFKRILSEPYTYAFIAQNDAEPMGYILCQIEHRKENEFQWAKTVLYIDQLSVEAHYRNQGVASQLLAQVTKLAKEFNVNEIQLDHWNKNEEAKAFFNAKGFEYFNHKMKRVDF